MDFIFPKIHQMILFDFKINSVNSSIGLGLNSYHYYIFSPLKLMDLAGFLSPPPVYHLFNLIKFDLRFFFNLIFKDNFMFIAIDNLIIILYFIFVNWRLN